jgi:glycosyltransferase involved in cell wall biosynthesis
VSNPLPVRIMVASQSHPKFTKGGSENAAFHLFEELQARPEYVAWFLGCIRDNKYQKPGATFSQPFSSAEFLYAATSFDWFKFSNPDPSFPREFRSLLTTLAPQIVHFHHYACLGVEAFYHVKKTLPDAKIILTLHEYLAICNHHGQMVTTRKYTLCQESSQIRCAECFPNVGTENFFLRDLYIKRFFDLVDHFVAPSEFLANRYIDWGIPRPKISVIENIVRGQHYGDRIAARSGDLPLRIGFFGQISPLKGIGVLLDAASILNEAGVNVSIDVYGDHSGQPEEFKADFLERASKVGHNVILHGPYEPHQVDVLMQSVDAVVVPSIWWENSPLVIQEAFRNRRPVICSDIGGMKEKVRDGVDGFHFPVGNSMALAALLTDLAADREKLTQLATTLNMPPTSETIVARHRVLYEELLGRPLVDQVQSE